MLTREGGRGGGRETIARVNIIHMHTYTDHVTHGVLEAFEMYNQNIRHLKKCINSLFCSLFVCLVDWFVSLIGLFVRLFVSSLVIGWFVTRSVGRSVSWLVRRFVRWLTQVT